MSYRLRVLAQALPFLLLAPGVAAAQSPSRGEAMAALDQPTAAHYTRQQIDQMVAPIALYPDQLLTQVLMAATYPQEIVDAAQWLHDPANAALKGDALVAALQPLPWDPSVKALVAFPQVIVMLSQHIEWTQALGVAFATQQPEVMARVQALRHLAMRTGRIRKVRHLRVREEGTAIVIASAEPDRVFVPVYNPVAVYGPWPDPGYQPVYLPPPPDFVQEQSEPGFEVSVGYPVIAPLWGWSRPDWRERQITINRIEFNRITQSAPAPRGDTWQHQGPVMLTTPVAQPHPPNAVAMPAGTIAPVAAAAVVQLPKRAAAAPGQIHMPSPTSPATQATGTPAHGPTPATMPGKAPENPPSHPTQAGSPPTHPAEAGKGPAAGTAQTHPAEAGKGPAAGTAAAPSAVPGKPTSGEGAATAAGAPHAKPGPEHAGAPTAATAPSHPTAPHAVEHPTAATAPPHPTAPHAAEHPTAATAPPHPTAPHAAEHPTAAAPPPHPMAPHAVEHPTAATAPPRPQPPHAVEHPTAATAPPHPQPPHPVEHPTAAAAPAHPQPAHPAAAATAPHPAPPHATAGQGASAPPHPQPAHAAPPAGKEEHKPEH
jgi:hypothetical protein